MRSVQSAFKIYFEFEKSNCALKPNVFEDKMFEAKARHFRDLGHTNFPRVGLEVEATTSRGPRLGHGRTIHYGHFGT